MKKLMLLMFILSGSVTSFAQLEMQTDSIPPISLDGARYKSFDGFILDMGSMIIAPPPLIAPQLTYQPYGSNGTILNYKEIFRPTRSVTYDRVKYPGHSELVSFYSTMPSIMQSATFNLKNGLKITTYGEYDADGRKIKNYNALPWERENFNGAFEIKSSNGNFGIRIEMQRGRHAP